MTRVSKDLLKIKKVFENEEYINEDEIEEMEINTVFIYDLKENASYIADEREQGYVRHSIESIILCLIFAMLANCNTFTQIHLFMKKHFSWLNKHIKFENGLPSISTVKRVAAIINPKELEQLCVDNMNKFLIDNEPIFRDKYFVINDIKSMDGKTANSSDRKSSANGEVAKTNAMSCYSYKKEYCLATEFIEKKTNEIPTGVELLKRVNIENCIIVFDALSTQTDTIKYIASNNGHYVAPVKGNQPTLEENIRSYFDNKVLYNKAKEENYYVVKEKAHGHFEQREYIFTNDVDWLYKKYDWMNLQSIGIAVRTYEDENGKMVKDTRYYISDLDAKWIKLISKAIRGEWCIENNLHYYLDTVFLEDKNKSFLGNSQKNLNIIRKFCMSILKENKSTTNLSMNSIRFNISMDFENEIEKIIIPLYDKQVKF